VDGLERPSYVNGSMLSGEFALNNEMTDLYKKLLNKAVVIGKLRIRFTGFWTSPFGKMRAEYAKITRLKIWLFCATWR
jgi:hypothetical protein